MDHTCDASGCAGIRQHAFGAGIRHVPEHLEQQVAKPLQPMLETSDDILDAEFVIVLSFLA